MAEVTIKKKVTIRKKQEEATFTFTGKLKVQLLWSSQTDLDLCIFFQKKDGTTGGVFSSEFRQRKADLGTLEAFPFIQHLGDKKEPKAGEEKIEQINIADLSELDSAYITIVNYTAAAEGEDATFAQHSGRVEVISDSGDFLEVLVDASEAGHVYHVCTIKNRGDEYALVNESKVMSLGDAVDEIPGLALICE